MKYFLLFLCSTCLSLPAQHVFESRLSHTYSLGIQDIELLQDGMMLMAANAQPPFLHDSSIAMLLKVDSSHQVLWSRRFKAFARDDFSCITQLSDGNFLIGGSMRQDFINQSGAGIYKVDSAGTVLWHKVYSDSFDDRVLEIFEMADSSLMIFIRHGVTNRPTKIVHASVTGDILSQQIYYFSSSVGVFAEKVIRGTNGTFYLTGDVRNNEPRFVSFVCALEAGSMMMNWCKFYDLGADVSSHHLAELSDGSLIVGGNIIESVVTNANNTWLMKLDDAGTVSWAHSYAQPEFGNEFMTGLAIVEQDEILTFGKAFGSPSSDGFGMRLDASGSTVHWVKRYNQFEDQSVSGPLFLPDGRMLLTGFSSGSSLLLTTSASGESFCSHIDSSFVVSVLTVEDSTVSPTSDLPTIETNVPTISVADDSIAVESICGGNVRIEEDLEQWLNVYPVPVADWLTIELTQVDMNSLTVKILDMTGRLFIEESLTGKEISQLDVSSLVGGVYLLTIQGNRGRAVRKFVKE
ncbi:MAG: T9SS type A sorting domain-containing protein [Bacteroidota bacterium]